MRVISKMIFEMYCHSMVYLNINHKISSVMSEIVNISTNYQELLLCQLNYLFILAVLF